MVKIHEEVLCGFRKCCPTVSVFEDGSLEITDNDPETGSVGTIKIPAESVARLVELIAKK